MEQEIDLRPYIAALMRRWRLIVGVAVLFALLAAGMILIQPRIYTYTAQILFTAPQNQIQFDSRFTTANDPLIGNSNRSRVLTDLANDQILEERVLPNLPAELVADDFSNGDLAGRFSVDSNGDLIRISISSTDPDSAETLLTAWVDEYLVLVNELYGFDPQQSMVIEEQLALARERYNVAQNALEMFIGEGELVRTQQRIAELEAILNGARDANQAVYDQYLERARQLGGIIDDAQTLRQQVQNGDNNALATNLGDLLLRARAAGNFELPFNLRFDLNETGTPANTDVAVAEISELIQVLEQRRGELLTEAQQFADDLAGNVGENFALPVEMRTAYELELARLQEQYEQLTARQSTLRQERDIAFESVGILQRKLDEQAVAAGIQKPDTQLVGVVQEPPQSSLSRLIVAVGVAVVAGVAMVSFAVLALEFLAQRRQAAADNDPGASDQTRDRTAAGQL